MPTFTWSIDITNGVMLNHALSSKLRFASVANSVFAPFVRPEPNYGAKKGQSVTIQRIRNISEPTSAVLVSGTRIPVDAFSVSTTSVTPVELGRAIEYEDLANQLNSFDLDQPIQQKLRQQMTLVMDTKAADAFKTAKLCFIPTSVSAGTWDTDGTPSTTALANLTIAHCGTIRDYLMDTVHAPTFDDGKYVSIASTKALRGIKNDPEFVDWRKYLQPGDVLYKSEVGSVEAIRFIECTHTNALSNAKGSGSVLGEAVVFGTDAVILAEVIAPHLRAALPGDFGRIKAIAWYGLLNFGIVWDTANDGEANIVRITSA
jgi:N4-gp56 family major capsid protein